MHLRRRPAAVSLIAAAVLTTLLPMAAPHQSLPSAAAATTSPSLRPAGKYAPAGGALLGAYVNLSGSWEGPTATENDIKSRQALLGRKLDIINHFYGWGESFPTTLEANDAARGAMPLISWKAPKLDTILNGSQDGYITARANAVKSYGKPVLLRWNWEFNGYWDVGGGNYNNTPGTTDGPQKFVSAWKRLHDIFAAAGVTNVAWVWCPNDLDLPAQAWNHWTNYYPGDAYVDWVGLDSYNWGTSSSTTTWHSLVDRLAPVYADYGTRKPLLLAEWGSSDAGGDKGGWIKDARSAIETMYPAVAALVWFDQSKETNWRIDSSAGALAAYQALAKDPYYNTATVPIPAPVPPALAPVANPAVAGRVAGRLAPTGGALLGLKVVPAAGGSAQGTLLAREKAAGRVVDIDEHDYSWAQTPPGPAESWDLQRGRIPMITWRPTGLTLKNMALGVNDYRATSWAKLLAGFGKPVLLRFAPGMNRADVDWAGVKNCDPGTTNGPSWYIKAWRHLHDLFVANGATNVVWVWAPDAKNAPSTPTWNTWQSYYPGDTYVDWVGVNGSNDGTTVSGGTWQSLSQIISPVYGLYRTTKPIMAAFTASAEQGGSKPTWLSDAAAAVRSQFPDVAAFVYDDDATTHAYALDSSTTSLSAWVAVAQTPYYRQQH